MIDTPISETAILGGAIGAAATGMRPIAHIMYANFLGVCGDELINQLTQMRYMFGGELKVPVTIMGYSGGGFFGGGPALQDVRPLDGDPGTQDRRPGDTV